MNNNKGFTLVELLATIAILGIISGIGVMAVSKILQNSKNEYYKALENNIIIAAKSYYADHRGLLPREEGKSRTLSVKKLVDSKYLANTPVSHDKKSTCENSTVKVTKEEKYEYSVEIKCGGNKQPENNPPQQNQIVCKKANTLHQDLCTISSAIGFCKKYNTENAPIIYGNLGTPGELKVGDAFNCDVNGDGIYDEQTERFYYVSKKDGDNNSDYLVLVYDSNVINGVRNTTATVPYSESNKTDQGPISAKEALPKTDEWSNVKLSSTKRNIKNKDGTVIISNFDYTGYAARLLTYQEINSCISNGVWIKETCEFLFENTRYSNENNNSSSIWLETIYDDDEAMALNSEGPNWSHASASAENIGIHKFGVRPVIEVKTENIKFD